jgi:hypothetical protein
MLAFALLAKTALPILPLSKASNRAYMAFWQQASRICEAKSMPILVVSQGRG